jgi:hypothetical protein
MDRERRFASALDSSTLSDVRRRQLRRWKIVQGSSAERLMSALVESRHSLTV